jgi:hypothetical protein
MGVYHHAQLSCGILFKRKNILGYPSVIVLISKINFARRKQHFIKQYNIKMMHKTEKFLVFSVS